MISQETMIHTPLRTATDAKEWLESMAATDAIHLEDDPSTIIYYESGELCYTTYEAENLTRRVDEVFDLLDDPWPVYYDFLVEHKRLPSGEEEDDEAAG